MSEQDNTEQQMASGWIPYPEDRLEELLENAAPEIRQCISTLTEQVQKLSEIGVALSAERELPKLLERIVEEARNLTHADGGSIYLLDEDKTELHIEIAQTASLGIHMGGTGEEVDFPSVPLFTGEGLPNYNNTSAYCALTGEVIHIPDVYETDGEFDFTGPKQFDRTHDYRTKSQLSVPLRNHEEEIIGVLQLINARDAEAGEVVPFSGEGQALASSLASQAAVAITNTQLIRDLRGMFDALIRVIAEAIDEKSPYTGGHIERVAELTMQIARAVNEDEDELPGNRFSTDQMEELRLASWLHDIGKITTPEWVVEKSTKLETLYDRMEAVELRYEILKRDREIARLRERLAADQSMEAQTVEDSGNGEFRKLEQEREWLRQVNAGNVRLTRKDKDRVTEIGSRRLSLRGEHRSLLEDDEQRNLMIEKGTLNAEEREIIRNHVVVTRKMLEQLPYPGGLGNIPRYAGAHHERMDGSGYPDELAGEEIPLQARIMAMADVFEALTAEDRPYKEPMTLSEAVRVLKSMVDDGQMDARLFRVFVRSGVITEYAARHIQQEQIDFSEFDSEGNPIG